MAAPTDKRASELTAPVSIADTDVFAGYRPGTGGEPNLDIRASAGLIRAPIIAGLAAGDVEVAADGVVVAAGVIGPSSISRRAAARARDVPCIFDWITDTSHASIQARTNSNDLSASIAAALSEMSGASVKGNDIVVPYGTYHLANVEMQPRVYLKGPGIGPATPGATFVGIANGAILQVTASNISGLGVKGIRFESDYSTVQCVGIDSGTSRNFNLDSCAFENLFYEGFKNSGQSARIERVFTSNVLMERSASVSSGAIRLTGTDCYVSKCELGCGVASSANDSRIAGLYLSGSNNFFENNLYENNELGINITATAIGNHFTGDRIDLSQHYGVACAGSDNVLIGVGVYLAGLYLTNTKAAFYVTNGRNKFLGCYNRGATVSNKPSYGFQEAFTPSTVADLNVVQGFQSNWHVTAPMFCQYAKVDGHHIPWLTTIAAGVVSLAHANSLKLAPGVATDVTELRYGGAYCEQWVDGNVTYKYNAAKILTPGGVDWTPAANTMVKCLRVAPAIWLVGP